MSNTQSVQVEKRQPQAEAARGGQAMRPAVDIIENGAGITLYADLPGVSRDTLHLHVDRDTLLIEAEASLELSEDLEALYADVRMQRYERSFSLSQELDIDKIEARLNDGLLTVHLPKRAEVQPRRIEVNTA